MSTKRQVRCAIYTRKSTNEGLDQQFNSLDAQREACEAYIRSQAGEGWKALPKQYHDGGFSGGNLDRPAMQELLTDVDADKVDVIVVYKVDRLTRSLMDFAKIVDRLDARGVSFVSVTQAFNTTTSMGRLTLNVLLSFAQFEREVTGERIRDKIAASKAKGMWMGGNVPLGYDLDARRLTVNPTESGQVRHIFKRYLELGSGVALAKELQRDGVVSKRWISRAGRVRGGAPLSCGALYYLLGNRIYVGEIVHRGVAHLGEHEGIIDRRVFDQVQETLAANRRRLKEQPKRSHQCMLAGLVRNAAGKPLTTSFSYGRGGRLYRYYVEGSLDPLQSGTPKRVPAAALERVVLNALTRLLQREVTWTEALPLLRTVELHERSIHVSLSGAELIDPHESEEAVVERLQPSVLPDRIVVRSDTLRLILDRLPRFRGGTVKPRGWAERADVDASALLRNAHTLLVAHSISPLKPETHQWATAPSWKRRRQRMMLGLLAPKLQKAILQGECDTNELRLLASAPLAWSDQVLPKRNRGRAER